jgi:hypothetical protein
MSEGQSQHSVVSSVQYRQEAEVVAADERERAVAETAATAARLAMAELAAARAEVEAVAATDAACTTVVEQEALHGSSIGSSVSANGGIDDELKLVREAAREQAVQWATAHPQGHRGSSPDRRGRADGTPGRGARNGRAPDGDGSPDRCGRADGWVDLDRSLYGQHSSPSLDRYHDHHGIQAIVRDIGPDDG